jgi:hypothetical protein
LDGGQVLFAEGDPPNSMFVVKSGALRIQSGGVVYEDVGPGASSARWRWSRSTMRAARRCLP